MPVTLCFLAGLVIRWPPPWTDARRFGACTLARRPPGAFMTTLFLLGDAGLSYKFVVDTTLRSEDTDAGDDGRDGTWTLLLSAAGVTTFIAEDGTRLDDSAGGDVMLIEEAIIVVTSQFWSAALVVEKAGGGRSGNNDDGRGEELLAGEDGLEMLVVGGGVALRLRSTSISF